MLQKKLIWQIFPATMVTLLLAIVAVTWYASTSLHDFYLEESENDLHARAHLVRSRVEKLLGQSGTEELRSFCVQVGRASATRITVIDPAGKVLAEQNNLRMVAAGKTVPANVALIPVSLPAAASAPQREATQPVQAPADAPEAAEQVAWLR